MVPRCGGRVTTTTGAPELTLNRRILALSLTASGSRAARVAWAGPRCGGRATTTAGAPGLVLNRRTLALSLTTSGSRAAKVTWAGSRILGGSQRQRLRQRGLADRRGSGGTGARWSATCRRLVGVVTPTRRCQQRKPLHFTIASIVALVLLRILRNDVGSRRADSNTTSGRLGSATTTTMTTTTTRRSGLDRRGRWANAVELLLAANGDVALVVLLRILRNDVGSRRAGSNTTSGRPGSPTTRSSGLVSNTTSGRPGSPTTRRSGLVSNTTSGRPGSITTTTVTTTTSRRSGLVRRGRWASAVELLLWRAS